MTGTSKPPFSFRVIAIIFLLWNMMGDAAYLVQVTLDLEELARSDAFTAKIFADMPAWVWSAYALAVWLPTVGSILLLLRKRAATMFYAFGLLAVLVQFGYSFLATELLFVKGFSAAAFPAFIVVIAVMEILYSEHAARRGWIGQRLAPVAS